MSQEKTNNNLNHHSSINDNMLADNTKKKLPERKNRGLRMKFLEGKDLEAENDFYNNLFGEFSSDENFTPKSSEDLEKDSFDSDFDNSEFKSSENDFSDINGLEGMDLIGEKTKRREKTKKVTQKKPVKNKVFPNKNKNFKENNKKCTFTANEENKNNSTIIVKNGESKENNKIVTFSKDKHDDNKFIQIDEIKNIIIVDKSIFQTQIPVKINEPEEEINSKIEEYDAEVEADADDEEYISKKKNKKKPKVVRRITNKNFIDHDDSYDEMLNKKRKRVKLHIKQNENKPKYNKFVTINNDHSIIIIKKDYQQNKELDKSNTAPSKKVSFKDVSKKEKINESNKVSNFIREKPSQKDLLYEAIFTEIYNIKSLEDMQRLEELNKRDTSSTNKKQLVEFVKIQKRLSNYVKKEPENEKKQETAVTKESGEEVSTENTEKLKEEKVKEEPDNAPITEKTFLTFSDAEIYKKIFENFNQKQEPKKQATCSVSGEKAKYFDPITKQFYSNLENFKILRERYFQKEEDNLLFRIQTLSDLTSQKKERLKKMILSNSQTSNITNSNSNEASNKSLLSLVNKYGILKEGEEYEKKTTSRILIYYYR
jgi:hypothetical protein